MVSNERIRKNNTHRATSRSCAVHQPFPLAVYCVVLRLSCNCSAHAEGEKWEQWFAQSYKSILSANNVQESDTLHALKQRMALTQVAPRGHQKGPPQSCRPRGSQDFRATTQAPPRKCFVGWSGKSDTVSLNLARRTNPSVSQWVLASLLRRAHRPPNPCHALQCPLARRFLPSKFHERRRSIRKKAVQPVDTLELVLARQVLVVIITPTKANTNTVMTNTNHHLVCCDAVAVTGTIRVVEGPFRCMLGHCEVLVCVCVLVRVSHTQNTLMSALSSEKHMLHNYARGELLDTHDASTSKTQ